MRLRLPRTLLLLYIYLSANLDLNLSFFTSYEMHIVGYYYYLVRKTKLYADSDK